MLGEAVFFAWVVWIVLAALARGKEALADGVLISVLRLLKFFAHSWKAVVK